MDLEPSRAPNETHLGRFRPIAPSASWPRVQRADLAPPVLKRRTDAQIIASSSPAQSSGQSRKGNTFEIEAARLQSEIFNLGPALRKLARAIKQMHPQVVGPETDLTLEMLVRRSGKRWRLMQEGAQTELVFPDSPSVLVDDAAHRIEGFVHTISPGGSKFFQKVMVSAPEVHPSDAEATPIRGLDEIVVYVPHGVDSTSTSTSTSRVNRPVWGERWTCLARLHRCALSGSVIGATLTGLREGSASSK